MRTEISTDLLVRLMNATPEQYAAVEKILAGSLVELPAPPTEDVARNAFALLQRLEADGPQKRPTVLAVFRFYCVEGYSAEQVAKKCRCAKGTVMNRLRLIEDRTGMKPERFRKMSEHFARMEKEFTDSGAKRIYRRSLARGADEDEGS